MDNRKSQREAINKMNYELYKQLKDAGFPLSEHWEDGNYGCYKCGQSTVGDVYHCIPTLSELIEACEFPPDIFVHEITLIKFASGVGGSDYQAYVCCQKDFVGEICKTPEEAVAKLYLMIKAKEIKND